MVPKLSEARICTVSNQDGNREGRRVSTEPITRKGLIEVCLTHASKLSLCFAPPEAAGSQRCFNSDSPAWLNLEVSCGEPPQALKDLKFELTFAFVLMLPPFQLGSYLFMF